MKKFIKNHIQLLFGILIGLLLAGGVVYAANSFNANEIPYTSNGQTTVQGALNDLYTKSNTWINPSAFSLAMNSGKSMLATNLGIMIKKDGKGVVVPNDSTDMYYLLEDWDCGAVEGFFFCENSDYDCTAYNSGELLCIDKHDRSRCEVSSSGATSCT